MIFALGGNPNSGKTTLFNQLTGANQHVGNFPGVTVDKKEGVLKNTNHRVVDLPGIYSLSPYTGEEIVARDFLINEKPDCIINIVDGTNLERNLYLSLQLKELGVPMVIALNMIDEIRASGTGVDMPLLEALLGVPVLPVSAAKNEGIEALITTAVTVGKEEIRPKTTNYGHGAVHKTLLEIGAFIEDRARPRQIPAFFAGGKLIERDSLMSKSLGLNAQEKQWIENKIGIMEQKTGMDSDAALADMRYSVIEEICAKAVHKGGISPSRQRSFQIDKLLTHKYWGLPIFFLILLLMFYLTFGLIGAAASDLLALGIEWLTILAAGALTALEVHPVLFSLIIDGIFVGVGSVLSFLPLIVVLFFFLSILEDSGYMARVAFIMDRLLQKIGLSGRSFVPMIIGFGCTVPAVMATRTLANERDRKMTVLLTPFMSCSAKIPIYSMFTVAFFPSHRALVMISLYILGIVLGILSGFVLKDTIFKGAPVPFVMELPNYRFPSMKSVGMLLWDKAKDFLTKAFTVIFLGTIIIWFLQTFDLHLRAVDNSSDSILAFLGMLLVPIFRPIGFGDWRAVTALVTGFTAKEAVVSTLAVLAGTNSGNLPQVLGLMFSTRGAVSFLIFTLLYTPCVAAIAAVRRELGSLKSTLFVVAYQLIIAYTASFLFYGFSVFFS